MARRGRFTLLDAGIITLLLFMILLLVGKQIRTCSPLPFPPFPLILIIWLFLLWVRIIFLIFVIFLMQLRYVILSFLWRVAKVQAQMGCLLTSLNIMGILLVLRSLMLFNIFWQWLYAKVFSSHFYCSYS